MSFSIIILAAGQGKRMQSNLPKVLHTIGGVPMVEHVIKTAETLAPKNILVVYGNQGEKLKAALSHHTNLIFVEQPEPKGTGNAVLNALPYLNEEEKVLILCADTPLISPPILQDFIRTTDDAELGILTAHAFPPAGLGRIIRDPKNQLIRIVEEKEASPEEREITEFNTGVYWVSTQKLRAWLPKLTCSNAQQEYYLTDIVPLALQENLEVRTFLTPSSTEVLGINDKQQLAVIERIYQISQAQNLMDKGVTVVDPARLDVRGKVHIGKDVRLDINVILEGEVTLEEGVNIGPNVIIKNAILKKGTEVLANSIIDGASIGPYASVGPFARIRPGTVLHEKAKVGNFVEIKNANIGESTKVNHLSYIGDAVLGKHVNIGAGTITCNYDGQHKYQTIIGDYAFIGSDTQIVAPITIGEGVTVGAGTTVLKDVPSYHLIHNIIQQRNVVKEK